MKDVGTLFTMDENNTDGQLFGLITPDLVLIKPNYEAMIKGGHIKITEAGIQHLGKEFIKFHYTVSIGYDKNFQ